jgi:hypothetical protein
MQTNASVDGYIACGSTELASVGFNGRNDTSVQTVQGKIQLRASNTDPSMTLDRSETFLQEIESAPFNAPREPARLDTEQTTDSGSPLPRKRERAQSLDPTPVRPDLSRQSSGKRLMGTVLGSMGRRRKSDQGDTFKVQLAGPDGFRNYLQALKLTDLSVSSESGTARKKAASLPAGEESLPTVAAQERSKSLGTLGKGVHPLKGFQGVSRKEPDDQHPRKGSRSYEVAHSDLAQQHPFAAPTSSAPSLVNERVKRDSAESRSSAGSRERGDSGYSRSSRESSFSVPEEARAYFRMVGHLADGLLISEPNHAFACPRALVVCTATFPCSDDLE